MSTKLDKYLKYADQPTPKPMTGEWKLIAPSGQEWVGGSPMDCVRQEIHTRVPPHVALGRIARSMNELED